jgi:uncharacterized membrane protein YbhN (UPF0104 family)
VLTLTTLGIVFFLVDWQHVADEVRSLDPRYIGLASALLAAQIVLVTMRSRMTLRAMGVHIPLAALFRANTMGQLGGIASLPGVGQVLGRSLVLTSEGFPARASWVNTLLEKGLALLAITLAGLVAAGIILMEGTVGRALLVVAALLVGIGFTLGGLHVQSRIVHGNAGLFRNPFVSSVEIFGISLCTHGALVGAFSACGMAHDITLGVASSIAAFSIVILAISLPISIGGWGIRELAMITVLNRFDVDPAAAVATSITAGVIGIFVLGTVATVSFALWSPTTAR